MKRILQAIGFYLLLPWLYGIALLPFSWLYKLSDGLFFLIYYILRYRRTVVWKNLQHAFPNHTSDELKQLSRSFYLYLCDLFLEHVKLLTITTKQILARCQFENPDVLEQLYKQNKNIILMTGHYGNWEWGGNAVALQTSYQVYGVYQPLSNPYFDRLLKKLRTRFNCKVIRQNQALRMMARYNAPTATALLADQAPPLNQAYICNFLGQPTDFNKNPERIAKKFNQPVVYINTQRTRRGYYTIHARLITDQPTQELDTFITQSYVYQLAKDIQKQPVTWLWSHRRWKHFNIKY